MRRERLLDVERAPRRVGSTDLVAVDSSSCPDCGGPMKTVTADEAVLFRHGGHGATRHSVSDHCQNLMCRWSIQREVSEVTPAAADKEEQ